MEEQYEDILDLIRDEFKTPDLLAYWPELLRRYKEMGFSDPLTDEQRIKEFTYIVQQVRKYVFSNQKIILSHLYDLPRMLAVVDDLIEKRTETSDERKKLVYYAVRDEWLAHLRSQILWAIELQNRGDE